MDIRIAHDRLTAAIGSFAGSSTQTRQLARRLIELLPVRLQELKRDYISRGDATGSKADRLALTDPRYLAFVEELTEIAARGRSARIQYETHSMLFKARQSLRAFRR